LSGRRHRRAGAAHLFGGRPPTVPHARDADYFCALPLTRTNEGAVLTETFGE
jgi:hypothetical protein